MPVLPQKAILLGSIATAHNKKLTNLRTIIHSLLKQQSCNEGVYQRQDGSICKWSEMYSGGIGEKKSSKVVWIERTNSNKFVKIVFYHKQVCTGDWPLGR